MTNLTNGKLVVGYTGAATTYTAVAVGDVAVKLWGGAGGGIAQSTGTPSPGGAGGFTTIHIPVLIGDVIKLEIGQGGRPGVYASGSTSASPGTAVGTGGLGGWPDGGNGGSNIYGLCGGGGGSTRVYRNNVLVAVAGAGGGGGVHTPTRDAGAGGGTTGQPGIQTLTNDGVGIPGGGTQSAGGANNAFGAQVAPFYQGGSLQGGHGYPSTFTNDTDGSDATGSGGGGGFFGGAAGGRTGGYVGGGAGGSGYVAAGFTGTNVQGNRGVPPAVATTDPDYVAGVSVGAPGVATLTPTAGGNGMAVLDFAPSVGGLPTGKTVVPYQGTNGVIYTATQAGHLDVKAWGAGGAGIFGGTGFGNGACGGFTTITTILIAIGDVIRVEVGQGGQIGSIASGASGTLAGTGGAGGWPDGGNGGSNIYTMGGGGGGSTRVYKNGVLVAVAGAGGGAGAGKNVASPFGGASGQGRYSGAGGGTSGLGGTNIDAAGAGATSGGTQSAGGVNSNFPASPAPFYTGGSFQGGHGYGSTFNIGTDGSDATGSGGGGGFFGGAGAGKAAGYVQGTSGGSGFVAAGFTGATTAGISQDINGVVGSPGGVADADYPAGVGTGGTSVTGFGPSPLPAVGGNGAVVLKFNAFTIGNAFPTVPEPYSGAAQTYTVTDDGIITFEAWGGAGAGSTYFSANTNTAKKAGGGAYVLLKVPVKTGDLIKLEVGQGGQKGTASADTGPATVGGLGGWPDGGSAGCTTLATPVPAFGGGGGSTRIYLNNVLIGLAAGGGATTGGFNGNPGGALDAPLSADTSAGFTPATHYVAGAHTGTTRNTGQGQSFVTSPNGTGANGFGGAVDGTAANKVAAATAGAGGGWFGGGTYFSATTNGPTGGGSSYIHPAYFFGSNWIGATGQTPANGIGANRPTAVAVGGAMTATTTLSSVTAGGDGAVWMSFAAPAASTVLLTNQTLGFERQKRTFTINRTGTVKAKMWGGAGSGGTYFATTLVAKKGGAGGYTEVSIPVVNGDTISVEVGQGGQKPWSVLGSVDGANSGLSTANNPMNGGAGGWPDGGTSGRQGAAPWGGFGGGGGSTRIYKNGVLQAVAAGGGGSTGNFFGGSGGGTTGGQSADATQCGTGATQSAGGTADGASLKGAPGWTATVDTVETTAGAGGGGGYFGGGSNNGRLAGNYGSGGGGSSFVLSPLTGSTTRGVTDTGTPFNGNSGDRPAGVAVGGSASTAANTTAALAAMTVGGDGAAIIEFPLILLDGVATTVPYIGATPGLYVVGADGVLNLEAWGGGGGGGANTTQQFGGAGGGGGNISGNFNVFTGDVIKVEVAGGGQPGVSGTTGGLGGWPDGGNGGRNTSLNGAHGGGGGSTRIYLNGVLITVAAGGGGILWGGNGGVGGGTTGGTGSNPNGATGGSQTGPGVSTGGSSNAGHLQGGNGYTAAFSPTLPDDSSGGGGGGGWYGGGGGIVPARGFANAGGGSSYVATVGINVATVSATFDTPNDSGHKPAGVGQGGPNTQVLTFGSTGTAGGNGAAYLKLTASADQTTALFKATGADQTWTAPSFGTLRIRAYAAGGGGGQASNFIDSTHPAGWGGPGGYVELTLNLTTGDVITVQVGKGGVPGTAASGATGGWPDGGNSGRFVSGGFLAGSGGGSTRILKNGVLEAIAGAGGGGVGITSGGAGGGLTGDTGTGGAPATGGTQTAGGNSPVPTTATLGTSLHGGHGYNTAIATADDNVGGGGGGGFFGGGGGYAAGARGIPGAGGGSSAFGPDPFNTLTQKGTTGTGTPFQSTVLPPLTAYGGIGVNSPGVPVSGSDGFVVFYFAPSPGSLASGGIPTVQMVAPLGAAGSTVFAPVGTITMSVPTAGTQVGTPTGGFTTEIDMTVPSVAPHGAQNWTNALIGTVTMFMNLVGTPPTEAVVNLPIVDYDIVMAMDTTTTVHASALVDKLLVPLEVRMSNPRAFILGFANGDLGTAVNLTTVTAGAETGPEAPAALNSIITVSQNVLGSAAGSGLGYPIELTFSGNNPPRWFAILSTSPPNGIPQSGAPAVSTDPIPQITMALPLTGFAEQGIEVFADINAQVNMVSNITATGHGSALAVVRPANTSNFFPDLYVARVLMINSLDAQVHANANFFTPNNPLVVVVDPPSAIASHGASVLASILPAKIVMRQGQAVGFAGNFALAIPDMEDLVIIMTEPGAFSPVTAQAFNDAILVDTVDGYVDNQPLPPGIARIKLKRSQTPGAQPLTLLSREIALNEYDGVLYSRDGGGVIKPTPYLGFGKGRTVPPGGVDGEVLGVDLVWKNPPTGEGSSRLIVPPAATRILLANNFTFADRSPLEPVAAGHYPVHYRPFFLPKATRFTSLSVQQVDANVANASPVHLRMWLGLAEWNPILSAPTMFITQGHVDVTNGSGDALRQVGIDVTLSVGWYVSMFGAHNIDIATGQPLAPTATWQAWEGGVAIGEDFYPQGEPIAVLPIGSDLSTVPAITQFATVQAGVIADHAFVMGGTA